MTTAKAIDGITDPAQFEILAIRVLRILEDDCRRLVHLGISPSGKTIKGSLDSFCLVPGSDPQRFVMAAYTTAKLKDLEKKWLHDHTKPLKKKRPRKSKKTDADDGDLIKAARQANKIRSDNPDAEFYLHLCCNRRLDKELMKDVYKAAKELNVNVIFLEQSRIRDCLDTNPEGQWLRKEHLRIDAELLSLSFLKKLSKQSLDKYGQEFLITPPDRFVETAHQLSIEKAVEQHDMPVNIISGTSGSGKSVACYQILQNHIKNGGVGFRVPGEIASDSTSLEEAVDKALRSICPIIQKDAGRVALKITPKDQRLLIIIDDINRNTNPSLTLNKVLKWVKPIRLNKNEEVPLDACILMPVWDTFCGNLDYWHESSKWINRFPIGRMGVDDSVKCLQGVLNGKIHDFSETELRSFVMMLGYDPILIALFGNLIRNNPTGNANIKANEVISLFIDEACADAATSGPYLKPDYHNAFCVVSNHMLKNRKLYPTLKDVDSWLDDRQKEMIRKAIDVGKVCCIARRNGDERFEFRHDRILEHFLAKALKDMMDSCNENCEILSDPYYSEFLGRAIAWLKDSKEKIAWIRKHAPLSLIASIRYIDTNDKSQILVKNAKEWLIKIFNDSKELPILGWKACRILERTDSPLVLDVTETLQNRKPLALSRLANGDAVGGVLEFSTEKHFYPSISGQWLDGIIERAIKNHRDKLIVKCNEILRKKGITDKVINGALALAGYIGDDNLADSIEDAWDRSKDKMRIYMNAFWASLRCSGSNPTLLLDPMIEFLYSPPDGRQNGLPSERTEVVSELKFAMRHGVTEKALEYLIKISEKDDSIRRNIAILLERVDHPIAIQYIVRLMADLECQANKDGGTVSRFTDFRDHWDLKSPHGRKLSDTSLRALKDLWESESSGKWIRKAAFDFWAMATNDLSALQSIPESHPYFKKALERRVLNGDLTTVNHVIKLIEKDSYWLWHTRHVWCDELKSVVEKQIIKLEDKTPNDYSEGLTNNHYFISELIRDMPIAQGEKVLKKHWEYLKFSPLFIQAAIYIGTEETLTLAKSALRKWKDKLKAFKHIGSHFGFSTYGLRDRLTIGHVKRLLPYLEYLDDHTIVDMSQYCMKHGYKEWAESNLMPEFNRRREKLPKKPKEDHDFIERLGRSLFPSDSDLLEDLDWFEQQKNSHGLIWIFCEDFQKRNDEPSRLSKVLDKWLAKNPSINRLSLVAKVLIQNGKRDDLEILKKYQIDGPSKDIDRIISDAKYGVMSRSLT